MKPLARMFAVGLLGALFLVPAWTDARAQSSWEAGLKLGLSAVKLSGDDTKGAIVVNEPDLGIAIEGDLSDTRLGFLGGGYATMHVNKQFGVRLEALYFQKGGKGKFSGEITNPLVAPFTGEMTFKLDYFEIPLLAVTSFPAGSSNTFDLFIGPAVAFKVTAEAETEITILGESASQTTDIENIKGTDFGGVIGVGFTLGMEKVNLFAEARWEVGLTTIDDSQFEDDIKNSALGFMIGVGFPLGSRGAATP